MKFRWHLIGEPLIKVSVYWNYVLEVSMLLLFIFHSDNLSLDHNRVHMLDRLSLILAQDGAHLAPYAAAVRGYGPAR